MLTGSAGMDARREQIERQRRAEVLKDDAALTPAHAASQGHLAALEERCPNCGTWHDPKSHEDNKRRLAQGLAEQAEQDRDVQHYASPEGYQAQPDMGKDLLSGQRILMPDNVLDPGTYIFGKPPIERVNKGKGKKWRTLADAILAGGLVPGSNDPDDSSIMPEGTSENPPPLEMCDPTPEVSEPEAAKSAMHMQARRDPGEHLPTHKDPAEFRVSGSSAPAKGAPPPRAGQIPKSNVSQADLDRVNRKLPN
jgi:hypothetical protein